MKISTKLNFAIFSILAVALACCVFEYLTFQNFKKASEEASASDQMVLMTTSFRAASRQIVVEAYRSLYQSEGKDRKDFSAAIASATDILEKFIAAGRHNGILSELEASELKGNFVELSKQLTYCLDLQAKGNRETASKRMNETFEKFFIKIYLTKISNVLNATQAQNSILDTKLSGLAKALGNGAPLGMFLVFSFALILLVPTSRSLNKKLKNLLNGIHQIDLKNENFPEFSVQGADELSVIGSHLNKLIESLKKSKSALFAKTHEMQKLIDGVPALISHWDLELNNLASNSSFSEHYKQNSSEILGKKFKEVAGSEFNELKAPINRALSGETVTVRTKICLPSHKDSYKQVTLHPDIDVKTNKIQGLFTVSVDITEQRMLELERERITAELEVERLKSIRNGRLASLGEMSAGIAHEINNPLAIISGAVNLLTKFSNNPEMLEKKIAAIKKSCARIAHIVRGLQKFSRSGGKSDYRVVELGAIAKEALALTESKAQRSSTPISLECRTHGNILCNEVEIEQVLVNLVNNAIDAVKASDEKWVKIEIFEMEDNLILTVTDSGKGIPESVHNKLFEPFFTTKKVGEGTGLGLSISKGILDEHKASISLAADSANTRFEIKFTKAEEATLAA